MRMPLHRLRRHHRLHREILHLLDRNKNAAISSRILRHFVYAAPAHVGGTTTLGVCEVKFSLTRCNNQVHKDGRSAYSMDMPSRTILLGEWIHTATFRPVSTSQFIAIVFLHEKGLCNIGIPIWLAL